MKLVDSRRLTGPNVLLDRAGAVIDVACEQESASSAGAVISRWRHHARRMLDALGWERERLAERTLPGGSSLALSAPIDALYTATEVNEWAWEAALREREGGEPPDFEAAAARLKERLADEERPELLALATAAAEHGVAFLSDDEQASVGLGTGSRVWSVESLPAPRDVDWSRVWNVPVALVTGTNGKTTTVRLLAAMAGAAHRVAGISSTDWIAVGSEILDEGDYSGPGGARQVLRHPGTEVAILETARGGILRRGLALPHADVAAITNVAEDHLSDFGVATLDGLAEIKLTTTRVARRVVLNADDATLVAAAGGIAAPISFFSLDADNDVVRRHLSEGGQACVVAGGELVACSGDEAMPLVAVTEIPAALGGAARQVVANSLTAVAVALALELPVTAIVAGLRSFHSTPADNPGRLNRFELGGVSVLVDFAHNPHGLKALLELCARLPARRRLVTLGQAGDREDAAIRELARTVWQLEPDRILLKDLSAYLRGRQPGEVPAIIAAELRAAGAPAERIVRADSELDAVRQALAWAEAGDLLLLLVHQQRRDVLDLLGRLESAGWRPGDALPAG